MIVLGLAFEATPVLAAVGAAMCRDLRFLPGQMNEGERAENDLLAAGWDDPGAYHDPGVWVTADNQEIEYCDLTHGHLSAIIRMLRRELLGVHTGGWPQGEQAVFHLENLVGQREAELEDLEAEQTRRREAQFPS